MSPSITPGDPRSPEIAALLAESRALMDALFPVEDNHYLGPEALAGPEIVFLVARGADGTVLGTGALAPLAPQGLPEADPRMQGAEIKAMFTAPEARGSGVGAALLARLEAEALARGHRWLGLETGDALGPAIRLYERAGFIPCPPFGTYVAGPSSVFMHKRLTR
ncbi:GNAT family N-acetyltransferase [Profundibacterium mesophilum]|uniref:Amino-acid N-acetyltransferase n=1 Tax=Profundibacterium mesophilum KAUST100406-0324 TaxID=1037889 RepID=A0A921TCY6_9RHOB|nr:GNAT family N-acetyltransferase [Profundibacterium mesophilum]KAF0675507.1 amino-acid N-acetyltransferase [Profundibacterium mesophilum KAUST100406-0324]